MKNIQLIHEGEDYIRISFEENGEAKEADITGGRAIEAIRVLGEALKKESFLIKRSKNKTIQ